MQVRVASLLVVSLLAVGSSFGCAGVDTGKEGATVSPTPEGDDDDDDGSSNPTPNPTPSGLQSGDYSLSGASVSPDSCGLGTSYYSGFSSASVTVNGGTIDVTLGLDTYSYDVSGTALLDPTSGTEEYDFSDPATATDLGMTQTYDCLLSLSAQYKGTIQGNGFSLDDHYDYAQSGGECNDAAAEFGAADMAEVLEVATLPCSSIDGVSAQ